MMLIRIRLALWKTLHHGSAILFVVPFYAIDRATELAANIVTILCAIAASPAVHFSDWCIDRHNKLLRADRKDSGDHNG